MACQNVDIAIVGAGLIGSALALWLSKHSKFSIALIERKPALVEPVQMNERVVALGGLARQFLDDIDVFRQLNEDQRHAYQRMFVWDENSDGELGFDTSMLPTEAKRGMNHHLGHIIDAPYCNYVCQRIARKQGQVQCYFETELVALEFERERTLLSTKQGQFSATLVVAADGAGSWLRQAGKLFANHRAYQQSGIVTRIRTEKSHQDCAWQRFLTTGPLAILPLANNQSSVVWSADTALADQLLELGDAEFGHRLGHALDGRLGDVSVLAERRAFPLKSVRAEQYYRRGLVLVGDAAHSIHPLAGQGANLGFKDILCLGELVKDAEHSRDLSSPRLLSRYQAKRKADNTQTDLLMSALYRAYRSNWPLLMAMRGLGMNVVNRSVLLRRFFIEQASGT